MCFIIEGSHEPKVATKDIICWKTFNPGLISVIQLYAYRVNHKYKIRNWPVIDCNSIDEGFHSYINKKDAINFEYPNNQIRKCIIPKGSLYYKNNDWHDYVSNQIIILSLKEN